MGPWHKGSLQEMSAASTSIVVSVFLGFLHFKYIDSNKAQANQPETERLGLGAQKGRLKNLGTI
jgi:hypothetical protein